ncbi:carboxypeptidase-like regulatory domain-containing protein [Archangium sp.]|uniref:carboxypeptidase-like regulatory domain-containing protein n=1 Tax=Archangium sp. TaxID=1872627 RepID=UPI002D522343|nr:carboxypeptidase-like regulatory domain-containing protein [Archangium sp.]HYO57494.1 carboxypeptidase-like regulatory domain-containing protein [Archangium sp.]
MGVLWDAAAGSEDVEVRVVLGQSFSGVVHDEQGGAVAGVHVTTLLRDLGRFVETTTDAEGRFLLWPFTAVNYFSLTLHDVLAMRHVGRELPYARVGFTSFVGYAFGHNTRQDSNPWAGR